MKSLLIIEWRLTCRNWMSFILAIGFPVFFFLLYSGMDMTGDPSTQKIFVTNFMLQMTAFSMSSFSFFSFPIMLTEDKNNHWLVYIQHSSLFKYQYYISKIIRILLYFTCSILVTFLVSALVRDVTLSPTRWIGSVILLLFSSCLFLSIGLLISQISSEQLMTIVANIVFLGLAIIGGSWMPITMFPTWVQSISKVTPMYYVNQLLITFAQKSTILWKPFCIILSYAIILLIVALVIQKKKEVD